MGTSPMSDAQEKYLNVTMENRSGYRLFFEDIVHPFAQNQAAESLPHCSLCGELLRPHVLWFDEYYDAHADYQITVAQDALNS